MSEPEGSLNEETAYLLSSPENARRLLDSLERAKRDDYEEHDLTELRRLAETHSDG